MNDDLQVLPRLCLSTDFKRNLLMSGAGPSVQVFQIGSSEEDFPLSIIHCFDRENVPVEFLRPVADSGHFVVAGSKYLTVIHEGEVKSSITWIHPNRIREFNSEITEMYEVIDYSSTVELLTFSLCILHKSRRLIRYSIKLHNKDKVILSIKVTSIDDRHFCDRMKFITGLSSSTFFVLYTDSVVSSSKPRWYSRGCYPVKCCDSVISTSIDCRFVVKVSSGGKAEVLLVDRRKGNGSIGLFEEAEITRSFSHHNSLPTSVVCKDIENDDSDEMIIIGYEDGQISFNLLSGEIEKVHLESGPILAVNVVGSEVFYCTRSGTLGALYIPHSANSFIVSRRFSFGGIINSSKKKVSVVSSCSFHILAFPTTAILVMAEDIRVYLIKGSDKKYPIEVEQWEREDFNDASITVFPHDLYTSNSPRLLVALSSPDSIVFKVLFNAFYPNGHAENKVVLSKWGIDKILSVHLPPPCIWWDKSPDMRLAVHGEHNHFMLLSLDFLPSGKLDSAVPIFNTIFEEDWITGTSHLSMIYRPHYLLSLLQWVKGGTLFFAALTKSDANDEKINVLQYSKTHPTWEGLGASSKPIDLPFEITVATAFWHRKAVGEFLHPTIVGTKTGEIVIFSLPNTAITAHLSIVRSEITALSVYQCVVKETLEEMHLIVTTSSNRAVSLSLYRNGQLSLISHQKSIVDDAIGVYCIEEQRRKSFRVIVVGSHVQTLYLCLSPLLNELKLKKSSGSMKDTFFIGTNALTLEAQMNGDLPIDT